MRKVESGIQPNKCIVASSQPRGRGHEQEALSCTYLTIELPYISPCGDSFLVTLACPKPDRAYTHWNHKDARSLKEARIRKEAHVRYAHIHLLEILCPLPLLRVIHNTRALLPCLR